MQKLAPIAIRTIAGGVELDADFSLVIGWKVLFLVKLVRTVSK